MTHEILAPWLDTDLADREGETWRDVVGYEQQYQVSSDGRIKSLARLDSRGQRLTARILRQQLTPKGEFTVNLYREGTLKTLAVSAAVGQVFLPRKNEQQLYIRRNKDQRDNRVSNLMLGTQSESVKLSIALGVFSPGPGNLETGNYMVHQAQEYLRLHGRYEHGILVAKVCKTCGVEQPLSNYYEQKGRTDLSCKTCVLAHRKRPLGFEGRTSRELAAAGLRQCRKCHEVKPVTEFGPPQPGKQAPRICCGCQR
jgi:hypothetical protein